MTTGNLVPGPSSLNDSTVLPGPDWDESCLSGRNDGESSDDDYMKVIKQPNRWKHFTSTNFNAKSLS